MCPSLNNYERLSESPSQDVQPRSLIAKYSFASTTLNWKFPLTNRHFLVRGTLGPPMVDSIQATIRDVRLWLSDLYFMYSIPMASMGDRPA